LKLRYPSKFIKFARVGRSIHNEQHVSETLHIPVRMLKRASNEAAGDDRTGGVASRLR